MGFFVYRIFFLLRFGIYIKIRVNCVKNDVLILLKSTIKMSPFFMNSYLMLCNSHCFTKILCFCYKNIILWCRKCDMLYFYENNYQIIELFI